MSRTLPDAMSMTSRTNPRPEPLPRSLLVSLVLLVALGIAGTGASVFNARAASQASVADVQRAADLTRQLASQQEEDAIEAKRYREDSRRLQLAVCDQIEAAAAQSNLKIPSCPRVATSPR